MVSKLQQQLIGLSNCWPVAKFTCGAPIKNKERNFSSIVRVIVRKSFRKLTTLDAITNNELCLTWVDCWPQQNVSENCNQRVSSIAAKTWNEYNLFNFTINCRVWHFYSFCIIGQCKHFYLILNHTNYPQDIKIKSINSLIHLYI